MSTRELQIIRALDTRLNAVLIGEDETPLAAQYIGREDLWADDVQFPCTSLIHEGTEPTDRNRNKYVSAMSLSLVAVTISDPTAPLIAGHALWDAVCRALFPASELLPTGTDRLGGLARSIEYAGHSIAPREDSGATTAVMINLRVEYVFDASNPTL